MKKMLLACCLLMAGTAFAQNESVPVEAAGETTFSKNLYITGGIGDNVALTKGVGLNGFSGKIGIGSWFNERSGLRVVFGVGKREFDNNARTGYFSLGADYTLNLLNIFDAYREDDRFTFDLNVGAAYYRMRSGEKRNRPEVHVGLGVGYNFAPHWAAFAEVAASGMESRYSGDSKIGIAADFSIGLRYSFGRHDRRSGNGDACTLYDGINDRVNSLNSEVKRLNEEVNRLRLEIDKKKDEVPDGKVMIAPEHEEGSIDIFFEQYSSFLGEEQRAKIEAIGTWLKDNGYNIKIVAFSDNLNDAEIDGKLRDGRTGAIRSLLETEFGIDANRITVVNAEELGYKNVSGCNAKILFSQP